MHLGLWINWSFGRMRGATLTMTRQSGGFFIAFIALYVTTCATSFWRICCFILHRTFSSQSPRDSLHHQRQALLRNSNTATQSMLTLLWAIPRWRKAARRPIRRALPLLLLALVVSISFAIAGISHSCPTSFPFYLISFKKKLVTLYHS